MTAFVDILTAGDTLDFPVVVDGYKASDGWTLKYRLAPRAAGGNAIDLTAADDGDDYRVQKAAATTAGWAAGFYSWTAWVEKDSESYTVERGTLEIKADSRLLAAGHDSRGHVQKVLDAIRAVIENRASKDQQAYTIAGRSLQRTPIADLLMLESRYASMLRAEQAAEKVAAGLPNPNRGGVRFTRI